MPAKEIVSHFNSHGTDCVGHLFLPESIEKPPIVVMGHGLGAQQDFQLPAWANRFTDEGLAVFTFDYRHWGESGGEPRHLLVPEKQKEDWHAALAFVRTLAEVDSTRLAIWGSSFAGAHVIHVAAEDNQIKAVVSQVLAADTASAVRDIDGMVMLKSMLKGLVDTIRNGLGLSPLYLPLVGKPGDTAIMTTPECWEGYLRLVPQDSDWKNQVTARTLFYLPRYRATKVAHRVSAPTLLMGGIHDSLVSIEDIRIMATKMPNAVLKEYDCNHFEPYYAPWFDTFVTAQAEFLKRHLLPSD